MNIELVEWQRISSDTGLVECWWTHPFLDVLNTWNLKNKTWLEFGAGLGTASLREKCKFVDSIEANTEWAIKAIDYCRLNGLTNGSIWYQTLADGIAENKQPYFDLIPAGKQYDIISVDGIFRVECIQWAIDHFKGHGGILIIDNLDQDFVFISPYAMELVAPYEGEIFIQPGHINHEGKPWNTRYYKISSFFEQSWITKPGLEDLGK